MVVVVVTIVLEVVMGVLSLGKYACLWLVFLVCHITVGESAGIFLLGLVCILVGLLVVLVVIVVGVITSHVMVAEWFVEGVLY